MFHVNNNNEAKPCRAKTPENCRFYNGEEDTRHYETVSDAQSFIEEKLSSEHGETNKKVRYSFVKEFKKQEEKFEQDFHEVPNRFFNTDLRDKFVPSNASNEELIAGTRSFNMTALNMRMITALSQPSDSKINDEKVKELLDEEQYENVQQITDPQILKQLKTNRAWKATLDDKDVIVIDGNSGSKLSNRYAFTSSNEYFSARKYWNKIDLRKISGNQRVKRKTNVDLVQNMIKTSTATYAYRFYDERMHDAREIINANEKITDEEKKILLQPLTHSNFFKAQSIDALMMLENAQLEGKNFFAQKKYIKDHSGSVATAYEDKKNPDKIRQDMMKNTRLNKYFSKVEIDNDVDPQEFAQFEKEYEEIMDKLPKIPKGKEPELRLRHLGKHRAHGIYFPHKNVVSIDVKSGRGSLVHELAHQYDFAIKGNASLREDFRGIVKDYTAALTVPAGEPASKLEYLSTPTEILARGAEHYYSEKKGIKNSLIDETKFDNYDHAPFKNVELRNKMFAFFEKLHEEDEKN